MKTAFTLIELLVVIAITAVLLGIGWARYIDFDKRQTVKQAAQNLRNNLRLAAGRAINGEKDCAGTFDGYLLTVSSSNYTVKSKCGSNYGVVTTVTLPAGVTLSPTTTILFKALGQGVDAAKTITLSAFGNSETVTVNLSGEVQ